MVDAPPWEFGTWQPHQVRKKGTSAGQMDVCLGFNTAMADNLGEDEPILTFANFANGLEKSTNQIDITLPETNIAPENRPVEKEIPIGNHHF